MTWITFCSLGFLPATSFVFRHFRCVLESYSQHSVNASDVSVAPAADQRSHDHEVSAAGPALLLLLSPGPVPRSCTPTRSPQRLGPRCREQPQPRLAPLSRVLRFLAHPLLGTGPHRTEARPLHACPQYHFLPPSSPQPTAFLTGSGWGTCPSLNKGLGHSAPKQPEGVATQRALMVPDGRRAPS